MLFPLQKFILPKENYFFALFYVSNIVKIIQEAAISLYFGINFPSLGKKICFYRPTNRVILKAGLTTFPKAFYWDGEKN